jgi:hypothetical protein
MSARNELFSRAASAPGLPACCAGVRAKGSSPAWGWSGSR